MSAWDWAAVAGIIIWLAIVVFAIGCARAAARLLPRHSARFLRNNNEEGL